MNGMLRGLRVIEGSAFIAAPSAGMTLAQMGAEVIRFDPVEKLLETDDVLQLAGALKSPGRHDHAEPHDRNGGEDGGQD